MDYRLHDRMFRPHWSRPYEMKKQRKPLAASKANPAPFIPAHGGWCTYGIPWALVDLRWRLHAEIRENKILGLTVPITIVLFAALLGGYEWHNYQKARDDVGQRINLSVASHSINLG